MFSEMNSVEIFTFFSKRNKEYENYFTVFLLTLYINQKLENIKKKKEKYGYSLLIILIYPFKNLPKFSVISL